jgi:hypothetical protein
LNKTKKDAPPVVRNEEQKREDEVIRRARLNRIGYQIVCRIGTNPGLENTRNMVVDENILSTQNSVGQGRTVQATTN